MKVYFSHGKESGPWGNKIKRLAAIASEHGCEVGSSLNRCRAPAAPFYYFTDRNMRKTSVLIE